MSNPHFRKEPCPGCVMRDADKEAAFRFFGRLMKWVREQEDECECKLAKLRSWRLQLETAEKALGERK